MSMQPALPHQPWPLEPELAGKIVAPGDEGFDEARGAWNLTVDQKPAAVVFSETAEDVRAAVRLAAGHGLRVAAQGTSSW